MNQTTWSASVSARTLVHLLLLWPAALWLAWLALSQVSFFYPQDYRWLNIPATIEQYVPQNRQGKQNFIQTNAAEHARLFSDITTAINHNGEGLSDLHYVNPQGVDLGVFLTPEEVTHLTDVSVVVDRGQDIGLCAFIAWLAFVAFSIWRCIPLPRIQALGIGTAITLGFAGCGVALIGPMHVFDAFHRTVFPANHPWFFYYQDSLMTTFMQAPNLFGLITAWWILATCLILFALWGGARLLMALTLKLRT
ncbi:MAG: lipoprotein intramolecular transacylase Lit [Halothiobacillus sp.]